MGTDPAGCACFPAPVVCVRGLLMRMITALAGWFTSTSRTPVPSPLPFDDGLVELARLIAVDDPTEAARPRGASIQTGKFSPG
jgi:hypothetical protein